MIQKVFGSQRVQEIFWPTFETKKFRGLKFIVEGCQLESCPQKSDYPSWQKASQVVTMSCWECTTDP
jgi:hypothetical protein